VFDIDHPPSGLPPHSFDLEGERYQLRRASAWTVDADVVAVERMLIAVSQSDAQALAALRGLGVLPADAPFALRSGLLAVSRHARRDATLDPTEPSTDLADLAREPSSRDAEERSPIKTSFEVRIVDETGQPLVGIGITFTHEGDAHDGTTDGDGIARVEVEGTSFALARLADPPAVEDELASRWATPRNGDLLEPGEGVQVHFVGPDDPLVVSLVAKTPHTVSLQQHVRLARLLGFHFDTKKSFLLPTALPNIAALTEIYAENPECDLVVVGHADPEHEADDADALSLERAESVAAYLRDDVDAWLTRYGDGVPAERRWGSPEDGLMLKSLRDYPDKPLQENAVRWFQRTRGLPVDGIAGPQTRAALVAEYMAHDDTTLPSDVAMQVHACGASFPLPDEDEGASDRHSQQEHRRVELFFFARPFGVLPEPAAETSDASSVEYPEWLRRARIIVDLSADGSTRHATLLEMIDALFRTDSCVVAPEGEDPSASAEHSSLSTIGIVATVLRFAEQHPDKKLLVAGHCDTSGSPDYNQPLSEERAAVALAMILGQRDEFSSMCHARHTVADYKQILSWAARALAFDCDPGTIDDVAFTGVEPLRRFQADYNANKTALGASGPDVAEDGAMGPQTWAAMFDCYEHALRLELDEDAAGVTALRDALSFVDDERRSLGFSEHFPIDDLGRDSYRSQANRRVEILFFDPGEEPDLDQAGGAPEMSDIYLPGRYERRFLDPELARNVVSVRLCTPTGEPIPNAPYTVTSGDTIHEDVADDNGFLRVHVAPDLASFVVSWSDPEAEKPELAKFTREVVLEIDDGDESDRRRLANLGYSGDTLAEQLAEYRAEFRRPESVTDEELLAEARQWHDGGERPVTGEAA
jgi:outer membrane protein OmpA-like peptidoglycan-associated protein